MECFSTYCNISYIAGTKPCLKLKCYFVIFSADKLTCPLLDPMPGCARPSKPNCFTGGPKCGGGKACCLDHDCTHKCVDPALPDGRLANKYFCSLNIVTLLTLKLDVAFSKTWKGVIL